MKCRNCGHVVTRNDGRCTWCGAELAEQEEMLRNEKRDLVRPATQRQTVCEPSTVYESQNTDVPPTAYESQRRRSVVPWVLSAAVAVLAVGAIALWVLNPHGKSTTDDQLSSADTVSENVQDDTESMTNNVVVNINGQPAQTDTEQTPEQQTTVADVNNTKDGIPVQEQQTTVPVRSSLKEIIAAIKDNYYGIQNNLSDFRADKRSKTRTWYSDSNRVLRKAVLKADASEGRSLSKEFYYDAEGNLNFIFAFDTDKNEYRYYFDQGLLYRYIDNNKQTYDYSDGAQPTGEAAALLTDGEQERTDYYRS